MEKDDVIRRFPLFAVQLARVMNREPPDMQDEAFLAKYRSLNPANKKALWLGLIMGGGASMFVIDDMCPTEEMGLDGDIDPILAECGQRMADNMEAMEMVPLPAVPPGGAAIPNGGMRESMQPADVNDFSATQRRSGDSFGVGLEEEGEQTRRT